MDEKDIKDNLGTNIGNNTEITANNIDIPRSISSKKAEKICAAIFLVSNFLNDQEPIKWDIRKASSLLASLTSKLAIGNTQERRLLAHESRKIVSELISLLEVANLAGIISGMNSSVLAKELQSLYTNLVKEEENIHKVSHIKIPRNFFVQDETFSLPDGSGDKQHAVYTRTNDHKILKDKISFTNFNQADTASKLQKSESHNIKEYGSVAVKRNKRQSFIIQILKRKKELTIKDISTIFHDCSEKTIQRELALLVRDGVVVRDGERRWTKYSLALTV